MTWYLGYCTTGMVNLPSGKKLGPFAVKHQLDEIDVPCIALEKVDFVRQGKRRYPDPVITPLLGPYVFIHATPYQFFKAFAVEGISPTSRAIPGKMMDGHTDARGERVQGISEFIDCAISQREEAQRLIDRGDKAEMVKFQKGDRFKVPSGPFQDFDATFAAMVEVDGFPMVEATVEIFGKEAPIHVDPLEVL